MGQQTHEKMLNTANHQRTANQNQMRYHLTPVRMAIINKNTNNKHWQGCGEKGILALYTVGGNVSWCSHHVKKYGCFSRN